MKKILISFLILFISTHLFSKIVEFSVDMTGVLIDSAGVHISGDFQSEAGFPGGDWQPNTTMMTQVAATDIYSVVVDIPAFAKYEYKILNGEHTYNVEFVPLESRVGFNFNDNRWIYVDSLSNDTMRIGAILFAGNAPAGKLLLRFKVDMSMQGTVDPSGVHVAGDFQGWDPATTQLYSFDGSIYEYIAFVDTGAYEYKYYNGNIIGTTETVPAGCEVNGNRSVNSTADLELDPVCFSSCSACATGISENQSQATFEIFPNPSHGNAKIIFNDNALMHDVVIRDLCGREIQSYLNDESNSLTIGDENLSKGIYYVTTYSEAKKSTIKLIIQ